MANARFYSSIAAVTTLQVTAAPSDASIQVTSSSGFPGSFPFTLSLDYGSAGEELVDVTAGGPNIFTVTRAVDGTSATTHNAGAVVRHVSSARDFTESRTHEAATTGVHGISGSFVDTTSVQSISNKTFTSSTFSGGTVSGSALAGTLTGSPTFSGNPTFSGTPVISGALQFTTSAAGVAVEGIKVTADTNDRYRIQGDGTMLWGPGNATQDTNLYRDAANSLKTDDALTVIGELKPQNLVRAQRNSASDSQYETRVNADTVARWFMQADGRQWWGPGNAAVDTNLYRSTANVLATDDSFSVGGDLTVTDTTWQTFTPSWTIGGSPATNTNVGWYKKIGKIVFFEVYTVWSAGGTGSTQISYQLPSTPFRAGNGPATTRQSPATGWSSSSPTTGMLVSEVLAGGSAATAVVSLYDNTPYQSADIVNGAIITLQGWYREA
jgi:hypothetical protein